MDEFPHRAKGQLPGDDPEGRDENTAHPDTPATAGDTYPLQIVHPYIIVLHGADPTYHLSFFHGIRAA